MNDQNKSKEETDMPEKEADNSSIETAAADNSKDTAEISAPQSSPPPVVTLQEAEEDVCDLEDLSADELAQLDGAKDSGEPVQKKSKKKLFIIIGIGQAIGVPADQLRSQ